MTVPDRIPFAELRDGDQVVVDGQPRTRVVVRHGVVHLVPLGGGRTLGRLGEGVAGALQLTFARDLDAVGFDPGASELVSTVHPGRSVVRISPTAWRVPGRDRYLFTEEQIDEYLGTWVPAPSLFD
ncbi:MAG: hypothetical protein ACTH0V_05095 [Microbacteriaceae bacterium]